MNHRLFPLSYKLIAEALLLVILGGILYFVAEVVLPGFFSSRIDFSTLYLALIVLVSTVGFLGSRLPSSGGAEESRPTFRSAFGIGILIILFLLLDLRDPWSARNLPVVLSMIPALGFLVFAILDHPRS